MLGPKTYPVQRRGMKEYPICPADPVTQTFKAPQAVFLQGSIIFYLIR